MVELDGVCVFHAHEPGPASALSSALSCASIQPAKLRAGRLRLAHRDHRHLGLLGDGDQPLR